MNQPPPNAHLLALRQEAFGHFLRGRADLARPLVAQLQHGAPQDPSTRQLALYLETVGFEWPARREPYAPAAAARVPTGIDMVSFHVDLPRAPSGIHKDIDYATVLAQSFESAALRAPAARRILLTDQATKAPPGVDAHRHALDRDRLMYERMRLQQSYLEQREDGRASVLMDSDVVVNRDPAAVFAEDFDVGLTWRPGFPDAPFNGGMIFAAPGAAARQFFAEARACYDALADRAARTGAFAVDIRAWWGDQFALAALVGYRQFAERRQEGLIVNGVRVRFFPCETHNFTLEGSTRYSTAVLRQKHFIHFKGNRKALQSQYLDGMRSGQL